jgi:hypothetical protein
MHSVADLAAFSIKTILGMLYCSTASQSIARNAAREKKGV